jgi:hypothetical protein
MLIYLNEKNDLDEFSALKIILMEQYGSSNSVRIKPIVYITKDNDSDTISSNVVQELGSEIDIGDWKSLVNFTIWGAISKYPAEQYFLEIWDHGFGWCNTQSDGSTPNLCGSSYRTAAFNFVNF